MSVKLVLADDHPLFLDGLEYLFRREKDCKVVARCQNGEETLQAVRKHRPDILILDIHLPGKDGLEVLRQMNKEKLPTRVVILAAVLEQDQVAEGVRLGVFGLLLKETAPRLVVECARRVHAGERVLDNKAVLTAFEKLVERDHAIRQASKSLTAREIEILRMAAMGMPRSAISQQLYISQGTVKVHLHKIYDKIQVENRLQLLHYALNKGLI